MPNSEQLPIVDNFVLPPVKELTITGEQVWLDHDNKRILRKPARRAPVAQKEVNVYQRQPITLRFESTTQEAETVIRLRVHSDGKIKTPVAALAKAHQTYAFEQPTEIISDAAKFNTFENRVWSIEQQRFIFGERTSVLPVKRLIKAYTLAPDVNGSVLNRVGELFTALLLFKGVGYEDVRRALKLAKTAGERTVTFNVNTTVTHDQLQFKVSKITVKKTTADGIFFCGKSCKPVQQKLRALQLMTHQQVNALV